MKLILLQPLSFTCVLSESHTHHKYLKVVLIDDNISLLIYLNQTRWWYRCLLLRHVPIDVFTASYKYDRFRDFIPLEVFLCVYIFPFATEIEYPHVVLALSLLLKHLFYDIKDLLSAIVKLFVFKIIYELDNKKYRENFHCVSIQC